MSPALNSLQIHFAAELQRAFPLVGVALHPELPIGEPTLVLQFDTLRPLHTHGAVARVQARLLCTLTGLPAHVQALVPQLITTLAGERRPLRDAGGTEIAQWANFGWLSSSYRQTDAVTATAEVEFEAVALLRLDPAAIRPDLEPASL